MVRSASSRTRTLAAGMLASGALALLFVVSGTFGSFTAPAVGLPAVGGAPIAAVHPLASPGGAVRGSTPHPQAPINCLNQAAYSAWGPFASNGQGWALPAPIPAYYWQNPCQMVDPSLIAWHDEVHATYSSNTVGSGSRVEIPLVLPADNAASNVSTLYNDITVSMVVSGDTTSVDNQSLAQIYFVPNFKFSNADGYSYYVIASLWSLVNNSKGGPTCDGLNLTWNYSFYCEQEQLGSTHEGIVLASDVAGGSMIDVTFVGVARSETVPLTIYVNGSSSAIGKVTLSGTAANNLLLAPAYSSSCAIYCFLNWTQAPFGLGVGIDLCLSAACDSYSSTVVGGAQPVTFAPPESWNGTAYHNEYPILATESLSGDCQGTTVSCPNGAITGFYPDFTFNGSVLNYGVEPPWMVENFGGAQHQFYTVGTATDFNPEFIVTTVNDSSGGYTTSSSTVTVTSRAAVFGNFTGLNLSYRLPNGVVGNETMVRHNGTLADGYWRAALPGTGGNGLLGYHIWATDRAGSIIQAPQAGQFEVQRGATLPTFQVAISTVPGTCGGVYLNGTLYRSGSTANVTPGNYSLHASLCYPYGFGGWKTKPGAAAGGGPNTYVLITANTSIQGRWNYLRPHDSVRVTFGGGSCGTIVLNGTSLSSAGTALLLDQGNYSLTESPCALAGFEGWTVANAGGAAGPTNLTILGSNSGWNLYLTGNGTLTLWTLPLSGSVTVTLLTVPGNCGGILLRGVGYTNDTQLSLATSTSYAIHQLPCPQYGFRQFDTSGGVSVSSGQLTVTATGTVTEENYLLTLVTIGTNPSNCGGINFDNVLYANGAVLNLTANSAHTAFAVACTTPVYHFTGFSVSGGVTIIGNTVTVNASGQLTANFQPGPPTTWLGFETSPGACGGILFQGQEYVDTNYTYVSPFTQYTISAVPCAGFGFVAWQVTGGVVVIGGIAYVNSSGSVRAIYHPLGQVNLYTQPAGCGAILLGGITYTNNQTVMIPVEAPLPLYAVPCAGYAFAYWENTSDGLVGAHSLYILAATFLTAVFVPLHYALTILVSPSGCGGLKIGTASYQNNTTVSLLAGKYTVTPQPCTGNEPIAWNASGLVTLNGSVLTVTGAGSVAVTFGPVPPTLTVTAPSGSYTGSPVSFAAQVAVPVPPYNAYSFAWTFGDGAAQSTVSNLTTHTYGQPGIYHVTVTVHDPYQRTANASISVIVTAPKGIAGYNLTLTDWAIVVGAIVAIGALLLAGRRRSRPPTTSPALEGSGGAAAMETGPTPPSLGGPEEPVDGDFAKVQEPPAYSSDGPEDPPS